MKVPMGYNGKMIDIKHLSNYSLTKLLDDKLSYDNRAFFHHYNVSIKKARLEAFDVAKNRRME